MRRWSGDRGANVWLVFAIREGKNREVRNVMAHLGLEVNRLIAFPTGRSSSANWSRARSRRSRRACCASSSARRSRASRAPIPNRPMPAKSSDDEEADAPRGKSRSSRRKKRADRDRKGTRASAAYGSEDGARRATRKKANGYGPPRQPSAAAITAKRDLKPRDE